MRLTLLATAIPAVFMGASLAAEPYSLTIGDRVIVDYDFLEEPRITSIDLDGNIRLTQLGSIEARGRTLDEVEAAITEGMIEGGFGGVPSVSIEIAEYAPVIVSGFVDESGRYDFLPGMTVGSAVAVAGGLGRGEAEGANADLMAVAARRRAADAAEDAAAAAAEIARLTAALAGPDAPVALDEAMRGAVPRAARSGLDARLEAEATLLGVERAAAAGLLASWAQEIADYRQQIELLDARLVLKERVIEDLALELADLENLRTQGLTTTARFSSLQQRLTDEREELLSLENSKIVARRAASMAERNRDQFRSLRRDEGLRDLATARAAWEAGLRDHGFALTELALLEEGAAQVSQESLFEVAYLLRGPRADRVAPGEVGPDTPILPGDILVVELREATGPDR